MKCKSFKLFSAVYVCLLLGFGTIILAQTPNVSPNPTIQPQQNQSDAEKIAVLQSQVDLMRNYNEKILDTVYWALGALASVVLLVIGLGWYTNFRIYKRDVEDIKREVKADISSLKRELLEAATSASKSAVQSIERKVKKLNYDTLESQALKHEEDGVYTNAVRAYLKMISLAKDIDYDFLISRDLEKISDIFKEKDFSLDPEITTDLMKILDSVSDKFSTDVEIVKEQIRNHKRRSKNI